MSGFPLNLDLTLYFEDLRKYACVFVDLTKCKEVSDVEKHVKSVFKLTDNICLTNKKYLIPSCEDIQILQQYETLKVQKRDFYDQQIHQNKQAKPACDQAALNLIQSERTIDLSCRPKQRLKINICQSNCIPGTQLIPFVEGCKFQSTPRSSVSSNNVAEEVCYIQSKESSKKKRCNALKHNKDIYGANGVGILDMSVKKSKRKGNDNVFSVNESGECDVTPASDSYDRTRSVEIEENFKCEAKKKSKKRKKQSESLNLNEDLDLLHSSLNNEFSDDFCSVNDVKKRKKRSNFMKSDTEYMVSEMTLDTEELQSSERLNVNSSGVYEEKSVRKNYKNVCNSEEVKGNLSYQKSSKKVQPNPLEINALVTKCNGVDLAESSCVIASNGKEYNQENGESFCNGIKESHSKTHVDDSECHDFGPSSTIDVERTISPFSGEKSISKELSISELEEGNAVRKKRIRKHSKKKKRERKEYLMALGPVLKSLTVKQPKSVGRHTFFSDYNFVGEVNSSTLVQEADTMVQGSSEAADCSLSQANTNQEEPNTAPVINQEAPDKLEMWQQELLKLAARNSPSLVFHRKIPSSSPAKAENPTNSSQNLASESRQTLNPNGEPLPANHSTMEYTSNCCTNGEAEKVNRKEVISATKETTPEAAQKLEQDAAKPIPTDFENIVLTDYPIIDKVVAEDLILFKVLKLNENNQPDVSKTILGKVADTSLPESICLQIIEGCEECRQFNNSHENSEGFTIELRWGDILEPRLFYP